MKTEIEIRQEQVWKWCEETFEGIAAWETDKERAYRFLEEAGELFQAMNMTKADAYRVIDYVFGRPTGELYQEIGGVMVTLLALASQQRQDVSLCLAVEYSRITNPSTQLKIRHKQILKNQELIGDGPATAEIPAAAADGESTF